MSEPWARLVDALRLELLGALLLAVVLGGAVGLERELRGKAAGLRTNILICVGAALFTQLSIAVAGGSGDPGRIAAQIVTGVGFIGAGTILHSRGSITGLTSAATIWLVAAIGVALGAGATFEAVGTTLLVILVLAVLGRLEQYVRSYSAVSRVVVEVDRHPDRVAEIERIVRGAGLEVEELRSAEHDDRLTVEIVMRGPARQHDQAKLGLLRASGAVRLTVEE